MHSQYTSPPPLYSFKLKLPDWCPAPNTYRDACVNAADSENGLDRQNSRKTK